ARSAQTREGAGAASSSEMFLGLLNPHVPHGKLLAVVLVAASTSIAAAASSPSEQPLDASGYATVEFGSPDLLLRYRRKVTHPDSCLWVLQNFDATPVEKAAWYMPCGDEAHTGFVSSLAFISALVCSMSIVLAASLVS
uniref:Uncharacterized protein n=1 Tax=Aegilops tauschii subsp. strangulata TaxID=200361 RepID=A0A452ZES9_AEGTS